MAMVICFSMLHQFVARFKFTKASVFTDSKYVIGILSSTKRSVVNVSLIDFLRAVHKQVTSCLQVAVYWIKGHSDLGGNNRVDSLSKYFASNNLSAINLAAPVHTLHFSYVE